jgi:hypothetical protein
MAASKKSSESTGSESAQSSAKSSMEKFKTEIASELGVNLKNGYNGNLTSRAAGSIGGDMVRRMINKQKSQMD